MRKFLILLAFLTPAGGSAAVVGLMDSGIDVADPALRERLHQEAMKGSFLQHPVSGAAVSWWDYNNRQFNQLMSAFMAFYGDGRMLGSSFVKTLASQAGLDPWLASQAPEVRAALMTWQISSGPSVGPLHENGVMHGTEAARLLTAALKPPGQLFHFAQPVPVLVEAGLDVEHTLRLFHKPLRLYFDALGAELKARNIRVLQVAIGYHLNWFKEILRRAHSMQLIPLDQAADLTPAVLRQLFYAEFAHFIESHPQVVFVMESGNNGLDLDLIDHPLHKLRRANTLVVGVLNEAGRKAQASNYGSSVLDLTAVGQPVKTVAAGIRLTGLPMAAPQVSARLADFAGTVAADMPAEELIANFLATQTELRHVWKSDQIPVLLPEGQRQSTEDGENCTGELILRERKTAPSKRHHKPGGRPKR